jgi:hypothetical protein
MSRFVLANHAGKQSEVAMARDSGENPEHFLDDGVYPPAQSQKLLHLFM